MYPVVEIKINNIIENAKKVNEECNKNGIKLSVVTKVLSDNKDVVKTLCDNGIKCISDSRIESLKHYKDINVEKWLIRLPMLNEIEDVVKYADASLNSEMEVVRAIDEEAKKQNKKHKVILMYELGDLREGMFKDELFNAISETLKLNNVILYGIGVNLSCYGEILPSEKNMEELSNLVSEIETKFNIKLEIVSGGNSTSYPMMKDDKLPKNINSLRFGEAVFLGNVPCINKLIDGLNHNNFILKTQIIELKEKPSIPWGESGSYNAFGEEATYVDRGIRKRAIIALGMQDVNINGITPVDDKLIVLGGSSDHIIIDVTDSKTNYKVGDIIEFNLDYSAILTLMTSKYVGRMIV